MLFPGNDENPKIVISSIGATLATVASSVWAQVTDDVLAWVTVCASIVWTVCNLAVLVGRKIQDFRREDLKEWYALNAEMEQKYHAARNPAPNPGHALPTPDPDAKAGGESAG